MREDLLGLLYRWCEIKGEAPLGSRDVAAALGGGLVPRAARWILQLKGLVSSDRGGLRLTPMGKARASDLILSHRLWETYLKDVLGLPLDHLHEPAGRMEHSITPELRSALQDQLEGPTIDSHGRPIPSPEGEGPAK